MYSIRFYSDSLDSMNVHCSLIASSVSHFVACFSSIKDINICTLVPNRKDTRYFYQMKKYTQGFRATKYYLPSRINISLFHTNNIQWLWSWFINIFLNKINCSKFRSNRSYHSTTISSPLSTELIQILSTKDKLQEDL